MIFLIWYKPYAAKQRNNDEIRNEVLVMIYMMLVRIYTPWVTDVKVRYEGSFVVLALICLNILISSFYIIKTLIIEVKKSMVKQRHENRGKSLC